MATTPPLPPESPQIPPGSLAPWEKSEDGRIVEVSPAERRRSRRQYASNALPRIIGYGLLLLFTFDIVQVLISYRPLRPDADANLVAQVVERIAVPLLAYALIFMLEVPPEINRFERAVRKVLSFGSLVWMVICLGLAVLSAVSGLRLYRQVSVSYQRQLQERVGVLNRLREQLPTLPEAQVVSLYNEMIRRQRGAAAAKTTPPEMRQELLISIPSSIETETNMVQDARRQAVTQGIVTTIKYSLGGLIAAILFLFAWEASYAARMTRVFRHRAGPKLVVEDQMASGIEKLMIRISEFSPLPNFEDYRWYRRLRRALRRKRDKYR